MNSNTVIRKNDVLDMGEPVVPFKFNGSSLVAGETLRLFPRRLLLESHAPGAGEHMRFIGASIGSFTDNSSVAGVVRITRAATRAPFSEADEELLTGLLASIKDLFLESASDLRRLDDSIRQGSELEESLSRLIDLNKSGSNQSESGVTHTTFDPPAAMEPPPIAQSRAVRMDKELSRAFNMRFGNSALDQLMESVNGLKKVTDAIIQAEGAPNDKLRNLLKTLLLADDGANDETWLHIRRNVRKLLNIWKKSWNVTLASALIQRLQQRRPTSLVSAECDIAALLEDTALTCEQFAKTSLDDSAIDAVVLSCLRFVEPTPGEETALSVVSVYPSWSREPAEEDQGEASPRSFNKKANGWDVYERMLPMTFRCARGEIAKNKHRVHPLTKWVTYGALVPFETFAFGRVMTGIISVDLAGQLRRNSESEKAILKTLAISASKCMWTLAAAELALLQKPAYGSLGAWYRNLKRTFRLGVDDNQQPKVKVIQVSTDDWANDEAAASLLARLTVNASTADHRSLTEDLSQLFKLGSRVKIDGDLIQLRVPLITINGVLEWLEIAVSSQAYQLSAATLLEAVRVSLLQFLVLSNDSKVTRKAFLKKDFQLDLHDSKNDLDFWRLVDSPGPSSP